MVLQPYSQSVSVFSGRGHCLFDLQARIKVMAGHLGWADVGVVMEKRHKERLRQKYPDALAEKRSSAFFFRTIMNSWSRL
jgi:hypothetical protein